MVAREANPSGSNIPAILLNKPLRVNNTPFTLFIWNVNTSSFLYVTPNTFCPSSFPDTSNIPTISSPLNAGLISAELDVHFVKLKSPL